MKNKVTNILIIICLILQQFNALGQSETETTSFQLGYNFIENKPTFDFLFNRKPASKAKDVYEIKLVKDAFVLNPSGEAHLGSGTKTSENNVVVNLNTYYKNLIGRSAEKEDTKEYLWTYLYKINIISPQASSDKDFDVYQAFITIGGDIISYYSRRDKLGYIEYSLGLDYDNGLSNIDSTNITKNVSRFKFRPTFQWNFLGKRSSISTDPVETDEQFYYKADIGISYVYYNFFKQDERLTDKHKFGYLVLSAGYRIIKNIKLVVGYKTGMVEPKYQNIDTFSLGISLIN